MTGIHWPSFWLGLFTPSFIVLGTFIVLGILADALNWLHRNERGPL